MWGGKRDMKRGPQPRRVRAPRWARLCAVFGAALMLISGGSLVATEVLVARYAGSVANGDLFGDAAVGATKPVRKTNIKGPLNILLVGIDPRDETTAPLSDSIMIVHVDQGLQDAYIFSIPRDLLVDIPAYPPSGFKGDRAKINSAMSYGSVVGNGKYDINQGFGLVARTVSKLTGIKRFDAGAIINFNGFKKIVDAMGGVTMTIDERTESEHLQPNGKPRPRDAYCGCEHPYSGPKKVYEKGVHHLSGWEALDFVRQRYGLKDGDYARQRHQQQFIKAITEQALSKNVVTNPLVLDRVIRAAGSSMIFDGKPYNIVEWGFALKGLRPEAMTMIKLPAGGVGQGRYYRGEELSPAANDFFAAINKGTVATFMLSHPEFVNRTS